MPNLLVYIKRGIQRKIQVNNLKFKEIPSFIITSPGGCGSISLMKYLENYGKTNLYFSKKYKIFGLGHIYKPSSFLIKKNIKIIIIKRDYEEIYNSLKSRGFLRNSLSMLGDPFPFIYLNIFKNEKKYKKRYMRYLKNFFLNWKKYNKKNIFELEYPKFFLDFNCQKKLKSFLNIKDQNFLKNFPKFKKYDKKNNFIDPSSTLSNEIFN